MFSSNIFQWVCSSCCCSCCCCSGGEAGSQRVNKGGGVGLMSRVWARVSVFESNLRPLGYFLLVYYGRVVLIVVVLLTGGK